MKSYVDPTLLSLEALREATGGDNAKYKTIVGDDLLTAFNFKVASDGVSRVRGKGKFFC